MWLIMLMVILWILIIVLEKAENFQQLTIYCKSSISMGRMSAIVLDAKVLLLSAMMVEIFSTPWKSSVFTQLTQLSHSGWNIHCTVLKKLI